MRRLALALLLASLAGCGSDAAAPATFSEVYDSLFPVTTPAQCNFCHSLPANALSNGNLHMGMDKATAYAALVGVTSADTMCMGKVLVVAGHPEQSLLVSKLSAAPSCGNRMPLGGTALTDAQQQLVSSWIANGAKDD